MLTLTAKQLFQSLPALQALVSQKIKSPRLAYNLGKTWKQAQNEAEDLRKNEREIFERFGGEARRLENGQEAITVDIDKLSLKEREEFGEAMNELGDTPIELWGGQITLEQIEAVGLELSASDFAVLDWLITDEEPAAQSVGKGA